MNIEDIEELENLYSEVDREHSHYIFARNEFEAKIWKLFNFKIDIIYQYGDGFVMVWEDDNGEYNSTFKVDEIVKLKNKEEFIEYLRDNSI